MNAPFPITGSSGARRRGLTLLEMTLALTITAMVGGAIAAMLNTVSAGVGVNRDSRTTIVRASNAQARLSAYVVPSRCVLDVDSANDQLTVWLGDFRQGDTVHTSEIRWLTFNSGNGTLIVEYVSFPDGWSQALRDINDKELAFDADWQSTYDTCAASGWIGFTTIADGLSDVDITGDDLDPAQIRQLNLLLEYTTESGTMTVPATVTIRVHDPPDA